MLSADLAVAVALLVLTPVVKGAGFEATVPGFWVAGALLAWAIRYRWVGGLVAGAVLCVVDVLVREDIDQANYGNLFLLLIGGPVVGFMAASLQQMAAERDQAEREAAAASERARLARVVHDGVLQVLALVQRRGTELGGDAAELGRLAGEQEAALRTLIRSQDSVRTSPASTVDLAAELAAAGVATRGHRGDAGEPVAIERGAGARAGGGGPGVPRQRHRACRGRCSGVGAPRGSPGSARDRRTRRGARHPGRPARAGGARRAAGGRGVDPRPDRGAGRHGRA